LEQWIQITNFYYVIKKPWQYLCEFDRRYNEGPGRATKMVKQCKKIKLYATVKISKSSVFLTRFRGDMTGMYKILTGKYDVTVAPKLQLATSSVTRGNVLVLATLRPEYTCKYSFTVRSLKLWNSLPNHTIETKL